MQILNDGILLRMKSCSEDGPNYFPDLTWPTDPHLTDRPTSPS